MLIDSNAVPAKLSTRELVDRFFPIYFMRRHLDVAAKVILGLNLAPHHAMVLREWGTNKPNNNWLSSRGMGKSVTSAIYIILMCLLYPKLKVVVAAGTAFRGAKLLLLEVERIILGNLSGQSSVNYARHSLRDVHKPIKKDPAYWQVEFLNGSTIYGIPLGANSDGEAIRGIRSHILVLDEAYLVPTKLKQAVLGPMQNVLYDMSKSAEDQPVRNMEISVSTIDYSIRDFYKIGEFYRAILEAGDTVETEEGHMSPDDVSYFNLDMEDSYYNTSTGKRVMVWGLDVDAIVKKLSLPTTDETLWRAENKNIPLNLVDNYFPYEAIDRGRQLLLDLKHGITFQPLLSCSAPCILGVDLAPSGANCAFTVVKVGTLDSSKNFHKCQSAHMGGRCPLLKGRECLMAARSGVVFAYQKNKMTQPERVKMIYNLMERFNLISIAVDFRQGGAELQDLLKDKEYVRRVSENPRALPIYDPQYTTYLEGGLPLLQLYSTTQNMNMQFNLYMKKLITDLKLIFPLPLKDRPDDERLLVTSGHIESLVSQVTRIRPVARGNGISYEIETVDPNTGRVVNAKKDLYSSLLYAVGRLQELEDEKLTAERDDNDLALPVPFTF